MSREALDRNCIKKNDYVFFQIDKGFSPECSNTIQIVTDGESLPETNHLNLSNKENLNGTPEGKSNSNSNAYSNSI